MDATERGKLITRYRAGYDVVVEALAGIGEAELDARPGPGDWTAREVAHHLADSEMTSAIRLRRLLAEEAPEIQGYDENEFARRLYYDRPVGASLEVLRAARSATAEILDRLTEQQWARAGTHSEHGRYSVEDWLHFYAAHAHDHADQIRRARGSAGS
jgi:DinB family protein